MEDITTMQAAMQVLSLVSTKELKEAANNYVQARLLAECEELTTKLERISQRKEADATPLADRIAAALEDAKAAGDMDHADFLERELKYAKRRERSERFGLRNEDFHYC